MQQKYLSLKTATCVVAIIGAALMLPAFAGTPITNRQKVEYEGYQDFWVEAIAYGEYEGWYLSDWDADYDHGAYGTYPPPPWAGVPTIWIRTYSTLQAR